jgi:hypothetical protein
MKFCVFGDIHGNKDSLINSLRADRPLRLPPAGKTGQHKFYLQHNFNHYVTHL